MNHNGQTERLPLLDNTDEQGGPALSYAVIEELTALRSVALSLAVAERPEVALCAVILPLACSLFYRGHYSENTVEISSRFHGPRQSQEMAGIDVIFRQGRLSLANRVSRRAQDWIRMKGFILGLIDETPDITLAEVAECVTRERRVRVAPSTVWVFLTKRDVTFKKTAHASSNALTSRLAGGPGSTANLISTRQS